MFAIELQAVYLRGTTTPLFGIIPVVTLFVVCAGAVTQPNKLKQHYTTTKTIASLFRAAIPVIG